MRLRAPLPLQAAVLCGLVLGTSPLAAQQSAAPLLGTPVRAPAAPDAALDAATGAEAAAAEARRGWYGRSGRLRAAVVGPLDELRLPFVADSAAHGVRYRWSPLAVAGAEPLLGTPAEPLDAPALRGLRAPRSAGVWRLQLELEPAAAAAESLTVITRVPFAAKRDGVLNGYRIGRYPAEGSGRGGAYAPPQGFIEVTEQTRELHVSEHFRLGQFLTKNQHSVWPKYIALDLRLIDKLELVLQELNAMGVRADRMHVMSGYRTPEYNGPGGNGRAALSRHTYGDAADVWVDSDGNGYMDDLNGDGRADLHDAAVMLRAVDRVEQRHPELVGGAGVYVATAAHGPFIHIDVRGSRARW